MLDQKIRLKSKLTEQDKYHFKMIDGVHINAAPNSEVRIHNYNFLLCQNYFF